MEKAWIGVDPGAKGAMVLLTESRKLDFLDWVNPSFMKEKFIEWDRNYELVGICVEDVELGGSGFKGVTKLAYNKGIWVGLATYTNVPLHLIRPQKWQKALIRKSEGKDTKQKSVNTCMRLFPKDNIFKGPKGGLKADRADACLMALYIKENC